MPSGRAIRKRARVKMGRVMALRTLAREVAEAIVDRMTKRAKLVRQPDGKWRYTFT